MIGNRTPTAVLVGLGFFLTAALFLTAPRQAHSDVELEGENTATSASVSSSDAVDPPAKWQAPWRGSTLSYRNMVSARTLKRDADLTYNPYYAMALGLQPNWWWRDVVRFSFGLTLVQELTQSDSTTRSNETLLSDINLGAHLPAIWTVPGIDVNVSTGLGVTAPTSKASQARTLILGLSPYLSLSRQFNVLSGINVSYSFGATRMFHQYTTAQREAPLIPGCSGSASGCDPYLSTGVRNPEWRLRNSFALSLQFVHWLGASTSVSVFNDFLPELAATDQVTYSSQADAEIRYLMAYQLEVVAQPMPALGIALGAETVNPQLAPDSTNERPFFNRYTVLYLDLRLDFGGLTSQIRDRTEG